MENFGFMQVLEGFWSKMLYFLRFWKVSDGNLWFYAGFRRFWKPNVIFAKVLKGFWWNSLVYQRLWKVWVLKRTRASKPFNFIIDRCFVKHFGAQGPQSTWSINFRSQIDPLWAMPANRYFSYMQAGSWKSLLPINEFQWFQRKRW